jgi:hypothetical protein
MSLKCSLAYLCLDDANFIGIHVFREAGTNEYWLELDKDAIWVPEDLAEDLAKVLLKHKRYEGKCNGMLKKDAFKPYYERRRHKQMLKDFFGKEVKK